jgi:AcrR family transcriptional regulator
MPVVNAPQRSPDTESAILEAAMMLFAEKGFSATTTRQIAQRAGVNEVTLFRHFRSKQELFHKILEEIQRIYPPLLEASESAGKPPEEILIDFCRLMLRRCAQAPHLVRLMLYAMLDEVHELREYLIEKRVAAYSSLLQEAMERLQAEGRCIQSAPPEILARLLMSQIFGLAQMSLLKLKKCDLQHEEELARLIASQFVRDMAQAVLPAPRT